MTSDHRTVRSAALLGRTLLLVFAVGAIPATGALAQDRVEGTFLEVWTDPAQGSSLVARVDHIVVDDAGSWHVLTLTPDRLELLGGADAVVGRRVIVEGRLEGPESPANTTAVSRIEVTSIALAEVERLRAPPPEVEVLGVQGYVTILCRFPGLADDDVQNPTTYGRWMNDDEPGMGHYWTDLSDGAVVYESVGIHGWYQMPQSIDAYFSDPDPGDRERPNWGLLSSECMGQADDDVDFSQLRGVNMQFNVDFGASWGGRSVVSLDGESRLLGTTWMAAWSNLAIYGHEIGHSFGLPHSSGPYGQPYDSSWDVMSNSYVRYVPAVSTWVGQHTNIYHKYRLGWVPPARTYVAEEPGRTERLRLGYSDDSSTGDVGYVMIPLVADRSYAVAARRHEGYDVGVPRRAIVIHEVDLQRQRWAQVVDEDDNGNPNDAGAAWIQGEYFDDDGYGVAVDVVGFEEDGVDVEITRGWLLKVSVIGEGRVTSPQEGLDCPPDCSRAYTVPSRVTLEAAAGDGLVFGGWSGSCTGIETCTIDQVQNGRVAAEFFPPLQIVSDPERPQALMGAAYTDRIQASGGRGSYSWSLIDGVLPEGLRLSESTGLVSGIPVEEGDFQFEVSATSASLSTSQVVTLPVGVPDLAVADVMDELLGSGPLITDERRYLDLAGNRNDDFDIGDVLLYLKRGGR